MNRLFHDGAQVEASRAIYNPSDKPVGFMNIDIASIKGHYDAFNPHDERTEVARKARFRPS